MNQQNQIKEGLEFKANLSNYPNRTFKLKQKIKDGTKGPVYISKATFWGEYSQKEFVLKFDRKYQVDYKETNFLLELVTKQNQNQEIELLDNVIRIFDYFEYQNYIVIVMEKYEQDLQSCIQKGEKLQICLNISLPIYYLHINNLIHSEIIIQNYVKVNDKFKLFNFGFISNMNQNRSISIEYTPPEFLDNQDNLNDKLDIWQLGCLFYQIYNGNELFQGDKCSIKKQIQNHSDIKNKISQLTCQPEMKDLIIQMLQPDPIKRISMTEVIDQLQKIQNPNAILISQKNLQKSISVNIVSNNKNQVNQQSQQDLKVSTQDKQPSNLKQSTQENNNNQKGQNNFKVSNENNQDKHQIQKLNNQNEEQIKTMKEQIEKELNQKFEEQLKAQESKYKEEILKYQNDQNQLQKKLSDMEKKFNDFMNIYKEQNQRQHSENRNLDSVSNQYINEVREDNNDILKLKKEKFELENQLKAELPKALKLFTQNFEKLSLQDKEAQIQNNKSDIMRLQQLLKINEE